MQAIFNGKNFEFIKILARKQKFSEISKAFFTIEILRFIIFEILKFWLDKYLESFCQILFTSSNIFQEFFDER